MVIDTSFDFTTDSPHYWDDFWDNKDGLGAGGSDPDSVSRTLKLYHKTLWSKELPCGERMELSEGSKYDYLTWNGFSFGSDSIIVSFRYHKNRTLIDEVSRSIPDYKAFVEDYIHRSYTIGGMTIFPRHPNSINQRKGTNKQISDRWDLTLECIRRYYCGETSPLSEVLESDRAFFDLFIDFKGYVDYFFFQDCVNEDYSAVKIWHGKGDFTENPLPETVKDYLAWIEKEMIFLDQRNKRIADYVRS